MKIVAGSICLVLAIIFLGLHFWMWKKRQKTFSLNKNEQTIWIIIKQNICLILAIFLAFATATIFISLI